MAKMFLKNTPLQIEYEYDFAIEGGTAGLINLGDATRNPGDLPFGFCVTGCVISVTTAVVGSTSTVSAGPTDDPNGWIAATA